MKYSLFIVLIVSIALSRADVEEVEVEIDESDDDFILEKMMDKMSESEDDYMEFMMNEIIESEKSEGDDTESIMNKISESDEDEDFMKFMMNKMRESDDLHEVETDKNYKEIPIEQTAIEYEAEEESYDRSKRQVNEQDIKTILCKDKNPGDFFRLVAGKRHCRDVVSCTDGGLQAIRCPPGLAFDLFKQTCEWKHLVDNCDKKARPKVALPRYKTEEPICDPGFIGCGDGQCVRKELFCDETPDCVDGSDETLCNARNDPNRASKCDETTCTLPDCFCSASGAEVPGGHDPINIPQMITISFDDAVNSNNFDIYQQLLNGERKNPNGCDIKATFFVSHKYTNYSMVQELHRSGHEIATHSLTHTNSEKYWTHGSKEVWRDELAGGRETLETFANIPEGDILGSRAPLLRVGGNRQFGALEESSFLYDSSLVAPLQNPPLWPYTVFFAMPHRCHGNFQKCPTRSFGVWEMVMNELDRREEPSGEDDQASGCVMLDSCSSIMTPDNLYNVLTHNFIRHYEQNRAPLGIYLHAAYFKKSPEMLDAFEFWIDELLHTYTDVYFVTMSSVLQWMQEPTDTRAVIKFPAWREKCTQLDTPDTCQTSHSCQLASAAEDGVKFFMQTCNTCPPVFPWLGDPKGLGVVDPTN